MGGRGSPVPKPRPSFERPPVTRNVSSLVEALDAAIAGEPGHIAVNRMIMLHEQRRDRSEPNTIEYWTLVGRIGKAVDAGEPGRGDDLVRRMLVLLDTIDQTRGVVLTRELREHQKDLFWILRSRIARDVGDHDPAIAETVARPARRAA